MAALFFQLLTNEGVEINLFSGHHPAGNVGIQIHAVSPLNKGEIVWTIQPQDVVMIGRLFLKGHYDGSRVIALVGSEVMEPKYYRFWQGGCLSTLLNKKLTDLRSCEDSLWENSRFCRESCKSR